MSVARSGSGESRPVAICVGAPDVAMDVVGDVTQRDSMTYEPVVARMRATIRVVVAPEVGVGTTHLVDGVVTT